MTEKPTYEELEKRIQRLENMDITERRQVEEALRQERDRAQKLLDIAGVMFVAIDANGEVTLVNQKGRAVLGYGQKEIIGKNWFDNFLPERIKDQTKTVFNSLMAGEIEPIEYVENAVLTKIGEERIIAWHNTILTDNQGNAVGTLSSGEDITERKRAEVALQEAYRIINRSKAIAFLWKNAEGWPVEFVSDNVDELLGYKAEDFTSGKIAYAGVVHPHDLEKVAKEVTTYSAEEGREEFIHDPYRVVTKGGKLKWVDDMTFIRRDQNGDITHYEGIVMDISERVRAEHEKEILHDKLQRSQKMESLGILAGGVAHDLNNVLSGIVSYPELILMDLPEDSKFRTPIETINESGHRAAAIVQDLLTMARGVATPKEPLNLNDIVGDYLNSPEFKKLQHFHPTVMVNTCLDTGLLNMDGSKVHIRKVVMNLVSNASEAIDDSGNVIISTMNRYLNRPQRGYDLVDIGEYVVLSVSDNGSGISSDDLERIFEPFYTKKVMGRSGTGLGLAVVWNTVQDHRGYIDVASDESGTTFELYFPISRAELSGNESLIPIEDYKGNGETILVVDDVKSQREISCQMLEKLGYKAKAVSSGQEAVAYLKENPLDLLLLDMIMDPGISGRETYERIIKFHPNQKAIIVSGFAETDGVRETQKLGAGKYIKKPLTLEKIGLAIKDELGK